MTRLQRGRLSAAQEARVLAHIDAIEQQHPDAKQADFLHLAKLEEAGYVETEKTYRGKTPLTLLRLTRQGHAAFQGYRKSLTGLLGKSAHWTADLGSDRSK